MTTASPNLPVSLVLITYVKPAEEVDALRPRHFAWIAERIEAGEMLLAGRRTPPVGGMLLFRGDPETVAPLASTDPYVVSGAATIEVVGYTAMVASEKIGAALA